MDIDKKLNLLTKIKEVESPPFLLDAILERLDELNSAQASASWKRSFIICGILILCFNIFSISEIRLNNESVAVDRVVSTLKMGDNNQFYND
ncbi:MAG: hypothetical protein EOO88_13265 [Pedobacter sp.]|nr:MAG: hypothetical protein EOO88_13265 [Pedobacter sp.]